jgi:hypothetical protein
MGHEAQPSLGGFKMSSNFWFGLHFAFVTLSHFLVIVLAISTVVNFFTSNASLLDRGRRFAIVFFMTALGINHITSTNSKCILTTLENEARVREKREEVGDFLPRYYQTIKRICP